MTLENKHVVIVGGNSGMGLGLAKLALNEGARVTIAGRSREKLERAKAELGGRPQTAAFDAGNPIEAEMAYAAMEPIDHLVLTAAVLTFAPLKEMAIENVQNMLNAKFWGPLLAGRYAAQNIQEGGSITFFSGMAAYRPAPGAVVVAAVNAAIEGLAKGLAVELSPIRVNVLSPGSVNTATWDFMPASDRQAFFENEANSLPTRYVGTPDDLAAAAAALMTNPYISGTVLDVDGGGRLA